MKRTQIPSRGASQDRSAGLRGIGEFGLIARLSNILAASGLPTDAAPPSLGIGDDAAIWTPTPGHALAVTTDALVEGVHFDLRTTSWRDLGWKTLGVNLSDLAGMGATARFALIALTLRDGVAVADVEELYRGMAELAQQSGVRIIGGDTVSGPCVHLCVTAFGELSSGSLRRDRGLAGDLVAVTGTLGASAGGLALLERGVLADRSVECTPGAAWEQELIDAHLRPRPRLSEGLALVASGVACGMDVSDGLMGDLSHICERSGKLALLERAKVPVSPALERVFGERSRELAIAGGEDYELLVTLSSERLSATQAALGTLDCPLTVVGRLEEPDERGPRVVLLGEYGEEVADLPRSWDHFRGDA
ncbi:MAG: thiamine-phosphate kinase [Chloroflexi bacterium]|nr:thiamine-phosphate kinase [Chloroflexota bacterium]